MNKIITIGRQSGSGGHEVGLRLANKLGIPFYDRELLSLTAEKSQFAESYLKSMDERKPNFLSFGNLSLLSTTNSFALMSPNDMVFIEVGKVIHELAEKGPCVIVGRCAEYVLKDMDTVNIFIYADIEDRVQRKLMLEEKSGLSKAEMEKTLLESDKTRAKFHEYYTHEQWGNTKKYDLCINTSKVGIDGAVNTILHYLSEMGQKNILPD